MNSDFHLRINVKKNVSALFYFLFSVALILFRSFQTRKVAAKRQRNQKSADYFPLCKLEYKRKQKIGGKGTKVCIMMQYPKSSLQGLYIFIFIDIYIT